MWTVEIGFGVQNSYISVQEQLYFSSRTVVVFGKISPLSLCKVVEIAKINLSWDMVDVCL